MKNANKSEKELLIEGLVESLGEDTNVYIEKYHVKAIDFTGLYDNDLSAIINTKKRWVIVNTNQLLRGEIKFIVR
jgi:hypothetical protein